MEERLVFGHSVEALMRALDGPALRALTPRLQALGVDVGAPLKAAYPLAAYIGMMDLFAESQYPAAPVHERFVAVGRAFMRGFGSTLTGRTLMVLMRVAGPRRAMERMTQNFRTANNYTEASAEKLAEQAYRVTCSYVLRPGFYQGVIESGLIAAGAKSVEVKLESDVDHRVVFLATWA